jgi:hypothetical protein
MKQKRRKLSMKVKDGLGPACPTCALPMQRWKHDPKWKPPARYYAYWHECMNASCKTKQVMPPEAKAGTCEVWMRTKNTSALPSKHLRSNTSALAHNDAAGKRRASTCGRPDIAAHPTNLSAEMRAAAAARTISGPGIRAISRHGN